MIFEQITALLDVLAWPIVVLVCVAVFKNDIQGVLSRLKKVTLPKGIELVLAELEKTTPLDPVRRQELSGLTSNEIWALAHIREGKVPANVKEMNAPQRVAARTLVDLGILGVTGEVDAPAVSVTPFGAELLAAAERISVTPSTLSAANIPYAGTTTQHTSR